MMSQRNSPARGAADVPADPCEIYVSHVDISWVQCYKTARHDETLSRFELGDVSGNRKKPAMAATAANGLPYDCRAAYRQTYWTSASRKSMSSPDMTATEAGRKAGDDEAQTCEVQIY